MQYNSYKEIKLHLFLRALKDGNHSQFGVNKETWGKWLNEYEKHNANPQQKAILEHQKNVIQPEAKLKLYNILIAACMSSPKKWEYFFEQAKVRIRGKFLDSLEWVRKEIKKLEVKININAAKFKQFIEGFNNSESDFDIYDELASIGRITGKQYHYQKILVGEYLAEKKLSDTIIEQQQKNARG